MILIYQAALASVRGPQLAQWVAELNFPVEKDSHMVFDLVKEFLQNAGQGQMILQVSCFFKLGHFLCVLT